MGVMWSRLIVMCTGRVNRNGCQCLGKISILPYLTGLACGFMAYAIECCKDFP
jgi:hypothetical protein